MGFSFFQTVDPEAARWQNAIFRLAAHAGRAGWDASGQRWRFAAELAPRRRAPAGAVLYAAWGAAELVLWLREPDWKIAAASALGLDPADPGAVDALPEALRRAALDTFARDALRVLERSIGLPVGLVRLDTRAEAPPASAPAFRLERADGLTLAGSWTVVHPDGAWRDAVFAAAARVPAPAAPAAPADEHAPIPDARVVRGEPWRFPLAEWDALEPGDVLLPPSGAPEIRNRHHLVVGRRLRFAARHAPESGVLTVEGKSMTAVTPASPAPDASAAAAASPAVDAVSLDAAEIELVAEVGRINLSLGEWRALTAGEIVSFATPVEAPVAITVGGRAVAVGELVDVGGRVGVRLLKKG